MRTSELSPSLQHEHIVTAGAYVHINGYFPFIVGPTRQGDKLGVVRPGGHREANESGWDCAVREVREEASLDIRPLTPRLTYWARWEGDTPVLQPAQPTHPIAPLLVLPRRDSSDLALSVMYLAEADTLPTPAHEAKGILLLNRAEIQHLCREPLTLGQYIHAGGIALLKDGFDTSLYLEPFTQLRLFAQILEWEPTLIPNYAQP